MCHSSIIVRKRMTILVYTWCKMGIVWWQCHKRLAAIIVKSSTKLCIHFCSLTVLWYFASVACMMQTSSKACTIVSLHYVNLESHHFQKKWKYHMFLLFDFSRQLAVLISFCCPSLLGTYLYNNLYPPIHVCFVCQFLEVSSPVDSGMCFTT